MRFCKVCGLEFNDELIMCPECGWEYREIKIVKSIEDKEDFEYKAVYNGLKLTKVNVRKNIEEVIIPDYINNKPVVELGANLFAGFGKLVSLRVPDTVRKIGANGFLNCYSLKKIELPNSIVDIGESCFQNCINLNQIVLPRKLDRLSKNILRDCKVHSAKPSGH